MATGNWSYQVRSILRKSPQCRNAEEIKELVTTMSSMFANIEISTDTLKSYAMTGCLEIHEARTVLCLQEESIDKFSYVLRGQVTLYSDHSGADPSSTGATTTNASTGPVGKTMKLGGARRRLRNYGIEIDSFGPGQFFGEYCCMSSSEHKSPFTIVTSEYTELLVLSKSSFQSILMKHFTSQLLNKATFLCTNYSMIQYLDIGRLARLCGISREKNYGFNEIITRQGSLVNNVYFIKNGLVKLSFDIKKINIADIRSKIHPPVGLLAQILRFEPLDISGAKKTTRGTKNGVGGSKSTNVSANTNSHRNKKTKISRPRRKSLFEYRAEREQTLRRYGYREVNFIGETLLCVLTTGGVLGAIEALGDLRENLFTATVESSSATLYQLNVSHFNSLFSVSCPEILVEEVLRRLLEHINLWKERFTPCSCDELPKTELFEVLVRLFDQKLQELEISRLMQEAEISGVGNGTSGSSSDDQPIRPRPHHYRRPENLPRLIKDYICH